jgi:hypothetical protein
VRLQVDELRGLVQVALNDLEKLVPFSGNQAPPGFARDARGT